MYNQVIKYSVLKNDLVFYTIGSEVSNDTWIVSCNIRAVNFQLNVLKLFLYFNLQEL